MSPSCAAALLSLVALSVVPAFGQNAQTQLDAAQRDGERTFTGKTATGDVPEAKPKLPRVARDADRLTGYVLSGGSKEVVERLKLAQTKGGLPPQEKWGAALSQPMTRVLPLDAAMKAELPMLVRLVEQMQEQGRSEDLPELFRTIRYTASQASSPKELARKLQQLYRDYGLAY